MPDRAQRRSKSWNHRVQLVRHTVQLGFASFVALVAVRSALTEEGSGNLPSPEAYSPMGGFETAYQYLVHAGRYVPHTHASNLFLAAALVGLTLALRGFFCGWICPLGALQELMSAAGRGIERRFPAVRRRLRVLRQRGRRFAFLDRWLGYLRYLVLTWVLAGTAVFGVLVFRDVDPWHALIDVTRLEAFGGLVILVALVLGSLFVERPWCRYACPLGAAIGLLSLVSPVRLQRDASACLACDVCSRACPVGIPVHRLTYVNSPRCTMCLQCVGACPTTGGLDLKFVLFGISRSGHAPDVAQPTPVVAALEDPL